MTFNRGAFVELGSPSLHADRGALGDVWTWFGSDTFRFLGRVL